jgi:hypothetical protein
MYKRSNIISRMIAIVCISVFALTSVPLATDSFAGDRGGRGAKFSRESRQHENRGKHSREYRRHERRLVRSHRDDRWRDRRHVISPRIYRNRHVVKRLPWGYNRTWYNRRPYFYSRGIFYRPDPFGFLSVRAPVGAIVVSLPIGYQRHWIDGTPYYAYVGTYYRRVPAGYVVVDRPPTVVIEDNIPEIVPPAISASGKVIVDAPVLNVRSGPSLNDKKIYQFDEGYILEVNGRSDGWLYVQLPNGEYGWVKSVFTKPLKPGNG